MLTGGTSGIYYPLGRGAAPDLYGKAIPEAKATVQATKASVENLNLLQAGRGEIAFTLGDALSDAWKGDEEAGFKTPARRSCAASPAIYTELHPDRRQRRLRHQDAGRPQGQAHLGRRAASSGTELNARADPQGRRHAATSDFAKVEYLPFGESVELHARTASSTSRCSRPASASASIRDLATSVEDRRRAGAGRRGGQDRRPGLPGRRSSRPTPTRARPPTCRPAAMHNFLVTHERRVRRHWSTR
ncbi:MAG: hypothetical protein MZV65_51935 [Chromatiales bacterium]|nr:hypothetical protein [Chromatiales bacterium]